VRKRRKWGETGVEVVENLKSETRITLCAKEILKMKKRQKLGLRKMEAYVDGKTMVTIYNREILIHENRKDKCLELEIEI
jgi:hypothetical protein